MTTKNSGIPPALAQPVDVRTSVTGHARVVASRQAGGLGRRASFQLLSMGVPAFFKWLTSKYGKVVVDAIEEHGRWEGGEKVEVDTSEPNPNGVEYDNLFLDMNGIIHPATHPEDRPAPKTTEDMMLSITDYVDRVFALVRPRRLLFMAIDGVAPRAKMNQQRGRRFKADQERRETERVEAEIREEWESLGREVPEKSPGFDSNVITPGTKFMHDLGVFLRAYVCYKQSTDPGWRNICVILSDASVPGEGEHKIMEYIRQQRTLPGYDPNTHHVLHGLDADLIMLALATHEPYFSILREYMGKGNRPRAELTAAEAIQARLTADRRGEFGEKGGNERGQAPTPFQFLHVYVLREYLLMEFQDLRFTRPDDFDFERLIDDFVFLCFFVGNDFLPHVPTLDIREGAIDTLLDVYRGLFREEGGGYLTTGSEVHLGRVKRLCEQVGSLEEALLVRRRQGEQRGKRQREIDAQQRTAERRLLERMAENAQTPAEIAAEKGAAKRPRPTAPAVGSSDASMLRVRNLVKAFAEDASNPGPVHLPATLSSRERAFAHQYCEELGISHRSEGSDAAECVVLSKEVTRHAAAPAAQDPPEKSPGAKFQDLLKVKKMLRDGAEVEPQARAAPFLPRQAAMPHLLTFRAARPQDTVELGKEGWRERYYEQKVGEDWQKEVSRMCEAYVEGLCWVMAYYYDGCPSWTWYYPFHYAPFASDLASAIDMDSMEVHFDLGEPFKPLEQLMSVLPPGSAHALPEAHAALMREDDSPLAHMYPTEFESDMNGKKFSWQAVVLLPFFNAVRVGALPPPEGSVRGGGSAHCGP